MNMRRHHILYGVLILTLLIRGVIPAGFMPSMESHATMAICHGMAMAAQENGDKPSSHRPCLFASEFITGKAVEAILIPPPQERPREKVTFIAQEGLTSAIIAHYQSRAPPVSFI